MAPSLDDAPRSGSASDEAAEAGPQDFVEFYERHYRGLVRYAARLTGDVDVARDVAQEALTRTFTRWIGVRNKEGYVYLVTTNIARDRWRKSYREGAMLRRIAATPPTAATRDIAVRDAVERLPKGQRDVVVLHYFADLTIEQIAKVVRRPTGTVKQRLFAARKALAVALGEHDD